MQNLNCYRLETQCILQLVVIIFKTMLHCVIHFFEVNDSMPARILELLCATSTLSFLFNSSGKRKTQTQPEFF